jgi:hypothetical protein
MAKKLPEGWSVKTKIQEIGLIDMYRYKIIKDGNEVEESFLKYDDRTEAREEGVKRLWILQEES